MTRVRAYCTPVVQGAVAKALQSVWMDYSILTSPPMTIDVLPEDVLSVDFLWLSLHGIQDTPDVWYGTERENPEVGDLIPAISLARLGTLLPMPKTIVFSDVCFLPTSYILPGLLKQGAAAVVGGMGLNYRGITDVVGSTRLGQWFMRFLNWGQPVGRALSLAKTATLWDISKAGRDSQCFQVYGNPDATLGGRK